MLAQWAAFRGFFEEELGLKATKVVGAIIPPLVEYVRGLEERPRSLEIEPDPNSVEEYWAILDDAWPSFVRGGIR